MSKIILTKKEFKHAMEVLSSASTEEYRPILKCVCFNNNEVVTLDGYRMSIRKISSSMEEKFYLLAKDLKSILKEVKREVVNISIDRKIKGVLIELLNKDGNIIKSFILKEQEGSFPNYRSLIPENYTTVLNGIDGKDMLAVVKKIDTSELCFNVENNRLIILDVDYQHQITYIGKKIMETISCVLIGGNLEIAFNPKYIKNSLKYYNGFSINFTGKLSAMTITSRDKRKLDLILPIRLFQGHEVKIIRSYKNIIEDKEFSRDLPF